MSRICEITGVKTRTGNTISHRRGKAGGVSGKWSKKAQKVRREWKPNLRKTRVIIDGTPKKLKISMKAYKKIKALS